MTPNAIVRLVTKLYAAAGAREATDVDFEVYAEALEDIADGRGEAAGRELIRNVDLVKNRPSPGAVRAVAEQIAEREGRNQRTDLALTESTERQLSSPEALAWLAKIRSQQLRRGGDPRPIGDSL